MKSVYICDYVRTAIGKFGGSLSSVRADDLLASVLQGLKKKNEAVDFGQLDECIVGCANQAGEDNRNIARMSLLLAGFSVEVAGSTVNRLCGSGMDAIALAYAKIQSSESEMIIAGGVENMSRAPFVIPKSSSAFSRIAEIHDTTIGWRLINPKMKELYGVDSMPETAENVAEDFSISREDQDKFAYFSQVKAKKSQENGRLAKEIIPIFIPQRKKEDLKFVQDEHLRLSELEVLAKLPTPFRQGGSVTAGNSSGVNDGAAAVLVCSEKMVEKYNLKPMAKILGSAVAGVPPRVMGIGPVPATQKLLKKLNKKISDFDIIELNEAFASQSIACLRELGMEKNADYVNPNGGAIALGHPLGMSGTRITGTAALELQESGSQYALATMCIGVGQGIAIALERI